MRRTALAAGFALASILAVPQLYARPAKLKAHPQAEAQTLDLSKQLIAFRSVRGEGNETGKALGVVKSALLAGDWPPAQVWLALVVWIAAAAALLAVAIARSQDQLVDWL